MDTEKKPTLDEVMKSIMDETVREHKANPDTTDEIVAMLLGLYEQGQQTLEKQNRLIEATEKLVNKEPVKVTTKEITFPDVMEVEEISPAKEISINNFRDLKFPDLKPFFDALSTENVKGQFAIIDAVDRLTEFLQSIDWSKLKQETSNYGGVITPKWHIETPTGSINGSNKTFSITMTPKTNSLFLFLGGMLQTENEDYTISRNVITYTNAPPEGVAPHAARFQV